MSINKRGRTRTIILLIAMFLLSGLFYFSQGGITGAFLGLPTENNSTIDLNNTQFNQTQSNISLPTKGIKENQTENLLVALPVKENITKKVTKKKNSENSKKVELPKVENTIEQPNKVENPAKSIIENDTLTEKNPKESDQETTFNDEATIKSLAKFNLKNSKNQKINANIKVLKKSNLGLSGDNKDSKKERFDLEITPEQSPIKKITFIPSCAKGAAFFV
tara:strand:- start:53 stop:715 length:663 start_codon:yes stop_codon:yes gene_type:complete